MARRTYQRQQTCWGLCSSDRAAVGGSTGKETAGTVGQAARRLRMPLKYSGIGATSASVVKAHMIQIVSRVREQGAPTSAAWDHVAVLFHVLTSRELTTPTLCLLRRLRRLVQLHLVQGPLVDWGSRLQLSGVTFCCVESTGSSLLPNQACSAWQG